MRKFVLGLALLFLWPSQVLAAGEFQTKYQVNYLFDAQGNSTVEQNISLTNLTSEVYASKYQLQVQSDAVRNITGRDSKGPLKITSEPLANNITAITVEFNDAVAGKGNTLNFILSYTGTPAVHNGQVWEVNLPGPGNLESVDSYELTLKVDPYLGQLAFITPQPQSTIDHVFHFTKDQLKRSGVVAAFGNFQTFGFNLVYHLENTENKPVYTEVALPTDTNYQRVFFNSITPQPISVRRDGDGNWLARFDLEPRQSMEVVAQGQAHILAEPNKILGQGVLVRPTDYLVPTEYWPTQDPRIVQIAQKLKTPEDVYNYVVNTLAYDYSRIGTATKRRGALLALENPTESLCTEFTDLFVTLARAAGIPAREVNGYAYANDASVRPLSLVSDVLHAWPQYYDSTRQIWIDVDPTWGNTTGGVDYFNKLDFDHFAFVIHGLSDSQPLSAGLYKNDPTTKDVTVSFATYDERPIQPLNFSWKKPGQIIPLRPIQSSLEVYNSQGQAVYNVEVAVSGNNIQLLSPATVQIEALAPFERVSIPVIFKGPLLGLGSPGLVVRASGQTLTYNIPAKSYFLWEASVAVTIASIIISVAIAATRAWSVYLQRHSGDDPLRGQSQKPKV